MKEKRTWEKILFLIRPYKLYVLCSLLCALLSVTASLLIPVFTGNVIDTFAEGAAGAWRPRSLSAHPWSGSCDRSSSAVYYGGI